MPDDLCACGWSFTKLDTIRQPEHHGYRYIGLSGKVYCSVYCGEKYHDTWPDVLMGWYPLVDVHHAT